MEQLTAPERGAGENVFAATIGDYAHNILLGTTLRRLDPRQLRKIELVEAVVAMANSTQAAELSTSELRAGLAKYLKEQHGAIRTPRAPAGPFAENLRWLGGLVGLDADECAVLQLTMLIDADSDLHDLLASFGRVTTPMAAELIAAALGIASERVHRALARGRRLESSRLLRIIPSMVGMDQKFDPKSSLMELLLTPGLDAGMLVAQLLTVASPARISWQDVTHLEEPARTARNLLAGALRSAQPGVNVLFYGVTGAGKTALAHLLAQDLGASLYIAGCGSELNESTDADDRLSSLMLGHCLLRDGSSIMLFDELEDLFRWNWHGPQGDRARGEVSFSKQWFNQLLETNPVPTIWISNRIEGIDPAFLRRFMYAIEFNPLGMRQRARVLARYLDEADGARVAPAEVEALAARYRSMPAQIATAVSAARLCAPDARPDCAALEAVLAPIEKIVQGEPCRQAAAFDGGSYDISVLNSRENLCELAESLMAWKPGPSGGLSICLYGPPGTGKTQYVRYLAHRMDRPVLLRRVSDIMRPYVGQTELEIAAAFRQAEQDGSILLFDEVDSFLRERSAAKHSWEVTAVNEFLQQLEAYRGIVACTTNLWRDIDPAALRRFMIKAELSYLRPEQAVALFKLSFAAQLHATLGSGLDAQLRAALSSVTRLAPGDFAIVARRVGALRRSYSVDELIQLLLDEVRAKAGPPRAIGFAR